MGSKESVELRDFYFSTEFFGEKFSSVVEPLLNSIDEEKGVPLHIVPEEKEFYYTTTATTVLLSLHHLKILNSELRTKLHELIFKYRDWAPNVDIKTKDDEDAVAWDVSESASAWCTSHAIWSLLETGYNGDKLDEIKDATLWLLNQQNADGGWGFDKKCESRIFFTSLVIKALHLSLIKLNLDSEEQENIKKAIERGISYILNTKNERDNTVFWGLEPDDGEGDATYTAFAIWSLHDYEKEKHEEIITKAVNFLREDLKSKDIWEFKEIVSEKSNTKYGYHKNIISFTPAMPLILLRLGIDPNDDLCLKPINWIKENRSKAGWPLPGYTGGELTFTTAMALWAVNDWQRAINKTDIQIQRTSPKTEKSLRKIIAFLIILVSVVSLLLLNEWLSIFSIVTGILSSITSKHGPNVTFLANIAFLGTILLTFFRIIDKYILEGKITARLIDLLIMIKNRVFS